MQLLRDSIDLMDSLLTDPRFLPSSYFPMEHYYAVFAPFFVPAFVPVFAAAIKRLKQWAQRRRQLRKRPAADEQASGESAQPITAPVADGVKLSKSD